MSSPAPSTQSVQSGSTRNPRRRQRNAAEEGSMKQQPQRKRTKLTADTFKPASIIHINGDAHHKLNGHPPGNHDDDSFSHRTSDIPVRGGKQPASPSKRNSKDDGSIVLTKNPNYSVKQLPALPEIIRTNRREHLRASFSPSNGYALALTHTQALVWDYTSKASTPPAHTFSLLNPARHSDPIPLGSLVPAGSSGDTGLVVINATTGKITFWESVENADALSLFEQRRNGVNGSCGSLLTDERLVDIENAEHAGFILTFSTGRTAQLLLRDTQSRSMITVNFLKTQTNTTNGGLFGGLRNVFTGTTWLKGVVAARTHRSPVRGNMEVIISNDNASFQIWNLTWSGQSTLQHDIDAHTAVTSAATSAIPEIGDHGRIVSVVDFAIVSDTTSSSDALVSTSGIASECGFFDLIVLVKVSSADRTDYALMELEITKHMATARRTIPLRSYAAPVSNVSKWKPRVVTSQLSETAFVVFERAFVLVSLATATPGPNSQLLMDVHRLPEPFQDTVYLREDDDYSIIGLNMEEYSLNTRQSSLSLFVERFGVVRITTAEVVENERPVERSTISAKSKIEQAVFFGTMNGNPLDLSRKSGHEFHVTEVEKAALEISKEICATDSPFIPTVAPSMDHHLEQRAQLLKHLALNLKQYRGLSRNTRWKLLFDAEKMAAARKVWTLYDKRVNSEDSEVRLLSELLVLLQSRYKTPVENERGERDHVRQWFLKDVWRMENVVAWPWRAILHLEAEKEIRSFNMLVELLNEACDIVLGSLETAFTFRTDNASLYGLEDESLEDGVLQSGYEDLPEFWTSTFAIEKMFPPFINGAREKLFQATTADDERQVERIMDSIPRLIDSYCKGAEERYRWYAARESEKERAAGEEFKGTYEQHRSAMIQSLADIGSTVRGMGLAEKYKDMGALVFLVADLAEASIEPSGHRKKSDTQDHVAGLEKRIRRYFDTYGDEWADTFYSSLVSREAYTVLLDQASGYKVELARFLKAQPGREKIGWINDVLSGKDYLSASDALLNVAESQEVDLWSKKVELSLAKLASLADKEQGHSIQDPQDPTQDDALQLVKLQEKLYEHVRPSVHNAVDQTAELQLAMEAFGRHAVKGRPALQQLLERGMENLIRQSAMEPEQLVDVLTLMDQTPSELQQYDIEGQEFFLALQVLSYAGFGKEQFKYDLLLKCIYRRCFIRDDWKSFDAAARRSDQEAMAALESTTLFRTIYEGYINELWDGQSAMRILSPADVLGAGTSPDDYRDRFHSADLRQPIAKDGLAEDKILQEYINKCRMAHWVTTTQEWAKQRASQDQESKAEHDKKLQQVVTDLDTEHEEAEKCNIGESMGKQS